MTSSLPQKAYSRRSVISKFNKVMLENGLQRTRQEGDGNCFFRCVSFLLYGTARHHSVIRQSICEVIDLRQTHYQPFLRHMAITDHLLSMRQNGTYADEIEIRAACDLYELPLEIWYMHPEQGAVLHRGTSQIPRNRPAMRLAYLNGNHYDSLMPIDTGNIQSSTNTSILASAKIGEFETHQLSKIRTTQYDAESIEEVQLQIAKYESILSFRAEIDRMMTESLSINSNSSILKNSDNESKAPTSPSPSGASTVCKRKLTDDLCDEIITISLPPRGVSSNNTAPFHISTTTNSTLVINDWGGTSLNEETIPTSNDSVAKAKRQLDSSSPSDVLDETDSFTSTNKLPMTNNKRKREEVIDLDDSSTDSEDDGPPLPFVPDPDDIYTAHDQANPYHVLHRPLSDTDKDQVDRVRDCDPNDTISTVCAVRAGAEGSSIEISPKIMHR